MDAGRAVKRAVLPSPVISDIPAGRRRPANEWLAATTAGCTRGAVYARPVSAGRKDERGCPCTTPVQGTGFIGFRGRDTTMDLAAQLRASTGGC
jgi:hypothetical protein